MCEKCQDRGFTEENHGLTMILCDCDKAREVAERYGIPRREDDSGTGHDDTAAGGADTSKPKQPSKRKARRRAAKRTS